MFEVLFLYAQPQGAHRIGVERIIGDSSNTYLYVCAFDVHVTALHLVRKEYGL